MPFSRVQALRAFFDSPPLSMDELKNLSKQERMMLAEAVRDEFLRRGVYKPEDFDFDDK
jgi:hypothetical protein